MIHFRVDADALQQFFQNTRRQVQTFRQDYDTSG
jgi:hypothetical protein